jgi:glycosyltransferase involved in cell wall biosynthesis
VVIGKGAICGVDGERFRPDPVAREQVRSALAIPQEAKVLLFLGRLNRDKGITDLAGAFAKIARNFPDAYLLLVGPDEDGTASRVEQVARQVMDRVRRVEFTHEPERFMAAADVFCLPSYREGFGMVVVEAAAAGLPAVASRIYGITDAVVDGETGLLHPPGDICALAGALTGLLRDAERRIVMGRRARARALADFSKADLSGGLLVFYGKMCSESDMSDVTR